MAMICTHDLTVKVVLITPSDKIDYLKNGFPDRYQIVVFLCYALQLGYRKQHFSTFWHMKLNRRPYYFSSCGVYPGLMLLLLLMQFSLIHAGSIQVEPQGLSNPRKERRE